MRTDLLRLPVSAAHRFYISIAVLSAAIAAMGFWPTYFGPLIAGSADHPAVIHVHAAIFSGWIALFGAQVLFAATGHIALHRKLGAVGIWYGVAIIVVGVVIDTMRQIEAQMMMRNYEGFIS